VSAQGLRRAAAAGALALLLGAGAAAPAAGAPAEGWAYDLADELMSPYCPGRALSECPSSQAEDLRRWIIEQERAGVARAEVEAELYRSFGDQLRQTPRASGVGVIAYAIPAAAFLAGGALVALFLRRQRRSAPAPPAAVRDAGLDAELASEIESELQRDAR
jgi:cytochrome c-type biogenesis protein CcmH/NrfF